jgi:TatD DNase family protein
VILADSHCHLQLRGRDAVSADPDRLLDRARAAGVHRFLVPGTTIADSEEAIAIASRHADVVAAVGIHPHEAKDFDPDRDGPRLEALARDPKVAAVGEVGLDFHYDHSPRPVQMLVLEWMLDLARRLGKPAILHNRESGAEMLDLLGRQLRRDRPGVYHSFTETSDYGKRALDLGYLVSFSGMLTFKPAENIREAARNLPLDSMLVETDTPFLAPVPHRGEPGEPAFVVDTARKLAEVKGVALEEVAEKTTANFEWVFGAR